jgi:hypothetical protein
MDGIFGGAIPGSQADYEEYTQQMRRVDAELQKYNQAMAMNAAQGSMFGRQQYTSQQSRAMPRFNPNESEAFQIPLSQAITLWKLKFGDTWWFDAQEPRVLPGRDFYTDVFDRIKKMGLFESTDGWYRLKEDV